MSTEVVFQPYSVDMSLCTELQSGQQCECDFSVNVISIRRQYFTVDFDVTKCLFVCEQNTIFVLLLEEY